MELAGLREGRDANVRESWIAQGSTTNMWNCFIDYTKDFDSVQHLKMC